MKQLFACLGVLIVAGCASASLEKANIDKARCAVNLTKFVVEPGAPSIVVHEKLLANSSFSGAADVPQEGSVLPERYCFKPGMDRQLAVEEMQEEMRSVIAKLWARRSVEAAVKTRAEAVVLASLIEAEEPLPRERQMISAVLSNRIKKQLMLQIDKTIIYPITRGKPLGRRIRQTEIADVNDYNTYALPGLPQGAILNPSREAIEAALNPADSKAIYYVSDGQGGHVFAETLQEHNRNVEKWFEIRRKRGDFKRSTEDQNAADDAIEAAEAN